MHRFFACIWDDDDRDASLRAIAITTELRASTGDWRTVVDAPGTIVLCIGAEDAAWQSYPLSGCGGVVLGALFQRSREGVSRPSAPSFSEHESRTIVQTLGQHLVRQYWGRYVAFLRDTLTRRQHVIRDPTGLLPCYASRIKAVDVYFSWLGDAVRAGVPTSPLNAEYVRARLRERLAYGSGTGLTHVTQVLGGERVTHSNANTTRALLWNPLDICELSIEDREHAAADLRRVTRDVVQAWARCYPTILHALSGGLDSSIVLACLDDARSTITCFNAVTSGAGDERTIARLSAQRSGYRLLEQHRIAANVKLDSLLLAPPYPEPINHIAWLEHILYEAPEAQKAGARAIFTGMGGDEIFARTGAAWALRDFIRHRGVHASLFGRAMDAARLEQLSVWRVLRTALWSRRWSPYFESDALMQSASRRAAYGVSSEPPALAADFPSQLPCGKRRHAWLLTPLPPWFCDPVSKPVVERVMPLRSQPLLELCLQIPTYTLIDDGWDRALARRAFQSDLAAEVVSRRTKGETTEYMRDVLVSNLPFLRDLLLKGRLVSEGFLDRRSLASSLSLERTRDPGSTAQIYNYIDVEVWLRNSATVAAGIDT